MNRFVLCISSVCQSVFHELWGYFYAAHQRKLEAAVLASGVPAFGLVFSILVLRRKPSGQAGVGCSPKRLLPKSTVWMHVTENISWHCIFKEYKRTTAVIRAYRWCITAINILTLFATMHCPSLACNSTLNGLKNDRTWLIKALHTVYFIFWLNAIHKISH